MNINKNVSVWRGDSTPPTIYHLWIKSDGSLYFYNGYDWVSTAESFPLASSTENGLMSKEDKAAFDDLLKDYPAFKDETNASLKRVDNSIEDLSDLISELNNDLIGLIVKMHADIKFSVSPTMIYKGEPTNVNLSHSATFDGKPLTYALLVDGLVLANPYTIQDTKTFNASFVINNINPTISATIDKSATVSAYYPRYYGRINKTSITEADIVSLEKLPVASSATISNKSITSSVADYLWLCVPSTMTITSVDSNGFAVPMEAAITVSVAGKGNYKCYRSTKLINSGTITFNVK